MYEGLTRGAVALLTIALAVATSVIIDAPARAAAPVRNQQAAESNDLRLLNASPGDLAEGKQISETSCARCHGADGISLGKGTPNLAGQRSLYIYAKLQAYRAGTRGDHSMEGAVRFLSEDAVIKAAAYYSSLEPAQVAGQAGAQAGKAPAPIAAAPIAPDPLATTAAAVAPCAGCHGDNGVTRTPGMPNLIGLDPKYFVAALEAYRTDRRRHDLMKGVVVGLGEAEMKNIALYFALQKPARAATAASGDVAAGKAAAAACAGCHGEQGISASPANPSLAGQDAQYLATILKDYKEGTRKEETMKLATSGLGDKEMRDLAAFYAGQAPRAPRVDKPLTLAEWVQRCDRCHGANGNSADARIPALAAQRADYLQKALRLYKGGQRKDSAMHAMSLSLTDSDVDALSAHYARQKTRSFVFVPVQWK